MMERFTDNARAVVRQAFRQQTTAPARDIVAAMASGCGIASRLLRETRVVAEDLPAVAVERQVLVSWAVEVARRRGVSYVGTEHLLLAVAGMPEAGLAERGASAERLDELLSAVEAEWRSRPSLVGRIVARCRSALGGRT